MDFKFLNLDYPEIETRFPEAIKKMREFFKGVVSAMEVEEDFTNKVTANVIQFDPRKLYDAFDSFGIRIFITDHPEFEGVFFYYNSVLKHSKSAESRHDAEKAAFMDAFEVLEKQQKDQ